MPPITNAPKAVLSAWTALEVLSPPSYRRPEDLAGGDRRLVTEIGAGQLPWPAGRARRKTRLYYQVVLGSLKLEPAVARLMRVYTDTRIERPAARGQAVLATVVVDSKGVPIDEPAVAISSSGWGVPHALDGNLEVLATWPAAERPLVEHLDKIIRRTGADGDPPPLDFETIQHAYSWLVGTLRLDADLVEPPYFAIRSFEYFMNPNPPEPLLLNSFFLADLAEAMDQFDRNRATTNLRSYLAAKPRPDRPDLLRDNNVVADAVAPAHFPAARWPAPHRHYSSFYSKRPST